MLAFRHDRTDHLAAVGCNLSCESNAFQGTNWPMKMVYTVSVLISLARVMLFRNYKTDISKRSIKSLNLSCESNAFQVGEDYFTVKSVEVLISLARVMLFREQTGR